MSPRETAGRTERPSPIDPQKRGKEDDRMRNRGALLASVMLIVLASMLVGAGTTAYFWDIEHSKENTFTIGTLNFAIANPSSSRWIDNEANSGDVLTGTWTASDWAPGEEVTGTLRFTNIGTIGIKYLYIDFVIDEDNYDPIYNVIQVTGLRELIDGYWYDNTQMLIDKWDILHNIDGKCQLSELMIGVPDSAGNPWDMVLYEDWDGNGVEDDELIPHRDGECILLEVGGEEFKLEITLLLPEDTPNEYQGYEFSFDMRVLGTNVGPTEGIVGPGFP